MLHEFLVSNRAEILARSRTKLSARQVPTPTPSELSEGLPLFLDQLIAILRAEGGVSSAKLPSVSAGAALYGGVLLRMGLTIGQVVQDYGSICQSVTELAEEGRIAISPEEFKTFNRCLDDAIAQAVTEYQNQRDVTGRELGAAHLGFLAHEMRNLLNTSMLAFAALAKGSVGVNGSTGTILGRSLRQMRTLIDRTLAEVRLEAELQHSDRVSIAALVEEIELIASVEANDRMITLSVDAGRYDVAVAADQQILASVVVNLVQNAFKFTRSRGHIRVRARTNNDRVLIDVEDECGGLPPGKAEDLFRPFAQRGLDKTGLGLGLSISLKGARTCGGEIHVRDRPGVGCIFTVDLPRAAELDSLAD